MRAVGYIRVSSEEQAESGLSLAHQRAKIEAYALAMDYELLEVIEDAGKSAKNLIRPGIEKAMNLIRARQADTLVILKLDRLTRSVKDLGTLVETFEKTGASLVSIQDSINTSTAAGRLVLNVLGSVAQWEREAIGERTSAAMQVKKSRGELVGAVPFGFNLGEDGRTLQPNEEEQEALRIMRELRTSGMSFRRIADELAMRGIQTKTGREWHPQTIKNLCQEASA